MTAPGPADVPPAPRSAVLCAPWASPSDIPESQRTLQSLEEWQSLIMQASEILFYLSGRQFSGSGCTETMTLRSIPPSPGAGSWPYHRSWGMCACWNFGSWLDGQFFPDPLGLIGFAHYQPMAIKLPRQRITAVTAVTQNGVAFTDYRLTGSGWLERTDGRSWVVCDDTTDVTFAWGIAPPESGVQAAITFAYELALSRVGSSKCQLPERVQSITRQGISVAVLDPQTFLKDGRTGLYLVDLFLAAVNPHGTKQRARVLSPDLPTGFRA